MIPESGKINFNKQKEDLSSRKLSVSKCVVVHSDSVLVNILVSPDYDVTCLMASKTRKQLQKAVLLNTVFAFISKLQRGK